MIIGFTSVGLHVLHYPPPNPVNPIDVVCKDGSAISSTILKSGGRESDKKCLVDEILVTRSDLAQFLGCAREVLDDKDNPTLRERMDAIFEWLTQNGKNMCAPLDTTHNAYHPFLVHYYKLLKDTRKLFWNIRDRGDSSAITSCKHQQLIQKNPFSQMYFRNPF